MPKSIHNSARCSCCQRFIPRKSGKRPYCSTSCTSTGKAGASRVNKRQPDGRRQPL